MIGCESVLSRRDVKAFTNGEYAVKIGRRGIRDFMQTWLRGVYNEVFY